MIESIYLRDFQLHKELKLRFSRHVTSIKGATDSGKSAIIRALRWACLNDMAGEEFIREGAKRTEVRVYLPATKLTDRIEIVRGKGGSEGNIYRIDEADFKAFGQGGVPDTVRKLLGLSEINFQGQHDTPFWFAESAPEVSRRLNAVIDLSVIDTSLTNIAGEVRKAHDRKYLCQERLVTYKEKLEEANKQRQRVEDFQDLRNVEGRLKLVTSRWEGLDEILTAIKENRAKELGEKFSDLVDLQTFARSVVLYGRRIPSLEDLLEDLRTHQTVAAPPDFQFVSDAYEAGKDLEERYETLRFIIIWIENGRAKLEEAKDQAERIEAAFHRRTKGQICPICGNKI